VHATGVVIVGVAGLQQMTGKVRRDFFIIIASGRDWEVITHSSRKTEKPGRQP
jgi:hypothetical protein